jgi:hypothetical protein
MGRWGADDQSAKESDGCKIAEIVEMQLELVPDTDPNIYLYLVKLKYFHSNFAIFGWT